MVAATIPFNPSTGVWNPASAAAYMDNLDEQERDRFLDVDCEVRVWDKVYDFVDFAQDYIDLEFSFVRNGAGGLNMALPGDSSLREWFFENPDGANATIPITVDTRGMQWPGKIDTVKLVIDSDGTELIEVTALHDWEHINRIACWPAPFAPIVAQLPRRMVKVGPAITVIKSFLKANTLRLQLPLWRVPDIDKLFDPKAWFNVRDANYPIAIVPTNPLLDTSRFTAMSARMHMAGELFEQTLKDAGLVLTVKLYVHGESEQPCPEWFILDRTTIVVDVVDKSGVTGPTGTVIDGVLDFFKEVLSDGVTTILHPILNVDEEVQEFLDDALGYKKKRPFVIWPEGAYSGIGEAELVVHKPLARDCIVGGRSADWVNQGIELGIKSLLGLLGQFLMVPGLDNLYQGQLSDAFLAWQIYTDKERSRQGGPYMYQEYVDTGGSTAFTINGTIAGKAAVFASRGYMSHSITIVDGQPYIFGTPESGGHFDIGDIVGFEIAGKIYTDYVTMATFKDDRSGRATWTITIGDGQDEEDPDVKNMRKYSQLFSIVKDLANDVGVT